MLCDRLGVWDGEGGREGDAGRRRYGNVCICVADSLCYKAETNTPKKKKNYSEIPFSPIKLATWKSLILLCVGEDTGEQAISYTASASMKGSIY